MEGLSESVPPEYQGHDGYCEHEEHQLKSKGIPTACDGPQEAGRLLRGTSEESEGGPRLSRAGGRGTSKSPGGDQAGHHEDPQQIGRNVTHNTSNKITDGENNSSTEKVR